MKGRSCLMHGLLAVVLALGLTLPAAARTSGCRTARSLVKGAVQEEAAEAISLYSRAIALCPESAALRFNQALLYYDSGRVAMARENLEQSLALRPSYPRALNALAHILLEGDNPDDRKRAGELARRAVALEPANSYYQETLAAANSTGNVDIPPETGRSRAYGVAVVIGNKDYENTAIPGVDYAIRDASVIKKYLRRTMGFKEQNIIYLENATLPDLFKTFGNRDDHRGVLYSRARKDKADIFIYYSGHGAPDPDSGDTFLLPVNADPGAIKLTGYPLDLLYSNLYKMGIDKDFKSVTVVFDACFSGVSSRGPVIPAASAIGLRVKLPVLKLDRAAVFTSSRASQISSWYPEKRHGLFTYFFLKHIKEQVEAGRTVTVGGLGAALTDVESVNDYSFMLYQRSQEPEVVGDTSLVLVGK